MSGAPPGYNPSDSLLSGGTTPITAVMGGGGASDSLLSGGDSAVIQGVQGGGKAKRALSYRRKRKVQRGGGLIEYWTALTEFNLSKLENEIKTNNTFNDIVNRSFDITPIIGKTGLIYLLENLDKKDVPKMIKLLIKNGVNVNEEDVVQGIRPILYAIRSGNADIVQILINAGADINKGTIKDALNPLSYACIEGKGTIARMLLKAGADLNAINSDGSSTLDVCRTKSDLLKEDFGIIKKFVSTFNEVSAKVDTYTCLEELKVSPEQYLGIGNLNELYESYVARKKLPWIEPIQKDIIPSSLSAPSIIDAYKSSPPLKRLITVIPSTTKNLVVFPPIYGDIIMLQKMLMKCEKMKLMHRRLGNALTIEEDTVFVFMPPFYTSYIKADTAKTLASNTRLFTAFLSLEANNVNSIFVLAEHTNDNVIGGKFLNPVVKDIPVTEIPNLLEPSYILYPYARGSKSGIILSAKGEPSEISLPARECKSIENTIRIKDLFNHHTSDAVHVVIEPRAVSDLEYIEDEKDGFKLETFIRFESTREVKVINNTSVAAAVDACKGFINSNDVNDTTFEKGKVTSIGPWTDTSGNKVPYFEMFRLIIGNVTDAAKPYCESAMHAVIEPNTDGNRFVASDEAKIFEQSANFVRVALEHPEGTKNYILRDPSEADTARHWDQLIFTEDEVAFLNDLNFSPDIVKAAFTKIGKGSEWKTELVGWMKTYVLKKCFEPVNLLTDAECVGLNVFMKTMYDYFESEEGQKAVYGLAEERRKEDEETRKRNEAADPIQNPLKDDGGLDVITDISGAGSREFTSQKITWNMINPIEVADAGDDKEGKGPNTYSLGLLMVKHLNGHPEQYRFGSVKVKANSTDEARGMIKTKIVDLRKTYPLWSFIY